MAGRLSYSYSRKVDTEMIGLADHYRNSPAVANMLEEIARQYPESKEIQPVKGEEGKIEPEKVDGPGSGSKKGIRFKGTPGETSEN